MSRSNYDKPFYVDVGTSIVAIRCASNHDVVMEYDYARCPQIIKLTKDTCDRMNKEAQIGKPLRNCDVGSVEEQKQRFDVFCSRGNCDKCPLMEEGVWANCAIRWSQMPYEEGETDE